ncbi:hypothetical protein HY990_02460 [Candidatus Micrarchaeota archaeon]|nr:hypothetical protein [Candidatus Micrarchaeota archaeon]
MANEVERIVKETVEKGGIFAMMYFDIHAKTKEAVEQLGSGFVNTLIKRPGVVLAMGEIDDPIEGESGQNWSSSVAVKILTADFIVLSSITLDHSPYEVDILRPAELKMPIGRVHELLALMSATTGEYKRYIITKVAKKEDIAQMQEDLKRRAEMGKKILEKKNEGK